MKKRKKLLFLKLLSVFLAMFVLPNSVYAEHPVSWSYTGCMSNCYMSGEYYGDFERWNFSFQIGESVNPDNWQSLNYSTSSTARQTVLNFEIDPFEPTWLKMNITFSSGKEGADSNVAKRDPNPPDPECGTAREQIYSILPAENQLCASGTPEVYDESAGAPYNWDCLGNDLSMSCWTNIPTEGVCGVASGQFYEDSPPQNLLCTQGTVIGFDELAGPPYYWQCEAPQVTVNCQTSVLPADGVCGMYDGAILAEFPSFNEDLCDYGNAMNIIDEGTLWSYLCSGEFGGDAVACFVEKDIPPPIEELPPPIIEEPPPPPPEEPPPPPPEEPPPPPPEEPPPPPPEEPPPPPPEEPPPPPPEEPPPPPPEEPPPPPPEEPPPPPPF